jgi:hypothetical protein
VIKKQRNVEWTGGLLGRRLSVMKSFAIEALPGVAAGWRLAVFLSVSMVRSKPETAFL